MKRLLVFVLCMLISVVAYAADSKVTDLPEVTAVDNTDVLYIVDGGTTSSKITVLNLFDAIDYSSELIAYLQDETGTGSLVFATSPVLITPALGTIASGVGTALTALNGDNILNDTIDDDSIDFSDVTGVDFTLTDCGAITSTATITAGAGMNLGTSQALIGTTAMTIGNNAQTIAINSSDWDIDATGIATGMGNITSNGTIEAATLTEGGNAIYNAADTPGGELGGTWASPTIDDSLAVTSWNLTTPTITTQFTLTPESAPTTDADGEIAIDIDAWNTGYDAIEFFNSTHSAYVVAAQSSDTPTNGQVPKFNTNGSITWEDDNSGTPGEDSIGPTELDDGSDTPAADDVFTWDGTDIAYLPAETVLDTVWSSTGILKRTGALTYGIATADSDYVTPTGTVELTNKTINATNQISISNIDETHCKPDMDILRSGIEFVIDGGGSEIADGVAGDIEIPFDCTIERATLLADTDGLITIDIWVDTYANFPPTVADTICGSEKPSITVSGDTWQDLTPFSDGTVTLSDGHIIRYNVDSCTTITRCTVSLRVEKR